MKFTRLTPYTYIKEKQTNHISELHRHSTLEILYVQSGIVMLESYIPRKNDKKSEIAVGAGQLVYIPPKCKHRQHIHTPTEYLVLELGSKENAISVATILHSEPLTKDLKYIDKIIQSDKISIFVDSVNAGATLSRLISVLHENSSNEDDYFDLEYYLLLNELFLKICQCAEFMEKEQNKNAHSRNALSFIEANYTSPITVSDIADFVGITCVRLNQLLQEDFHASAWELVQKKRMALSEKLLLSSDLGITKIAQKCGYSSIKTFRQAFVKAHRQSPTEFRNANISVYHFYADPLDTNNEILFPKTI